MSRRADQVASTIHRAVQDVINRGFSDPRISGLISVTDVGVDDDLTTAMVSVCVHPPDREELTLHGLRSAANYIRRQTGELVALRRMPALRFRLDKNIRRQSDVLAAINEAVNELESDHQNTPAPGAEDAGPSKEGDEA